MEQNREIVLDVMGMSCGSCVRHVDRALRSVAGVSDVEVRLTKGEVWVRHDAAVAPVQNLVRALEAEGYEARVRG